MGIAIFSIAGLLSPLQAAMTWLIALGDRAAPAPERAHSPNASAALSLRSQVRPAPPPPIRCARPGWSRVAPVARGAGRPALRVLRVVESHHGKASAGRMVISGRMADVCAELDRLTRAESLTRMH